MSTSPTSDTQHECDPEQGCSYLGSAAIGSIAYIGVRYHACGHVLWFPERAADRRQHPAYHSTEEFRAAQSRADSG